MPSSSMLLLQATYALKKRMPCFCRLFFGAVPFEFAFRYPEVVVEQPVVCDLRIYIGKHVICLDHACIGQHAGDIAVPVGAYLIGFRIEPEFSSQLPEPLDYGHGHAVSVVARDAWLVPRIHVEHPCLMHKAHLRIIRADVCPVDIEDVDRVLRHADVAHDLVERPLGHLEEIREILHEV